MRPLELLLTLLLALLLVAHLRRWTSGRILLVLPALTLLLVLPHLGLEGERWQMVPAYALTALLVAHALLAVRQPPREPAPWRHSISLGALVMLGLGTLLAILLPVTALPAPGGPYAVGTTVYHFVDEQRDEIYSAAPEDKREIVVQIWYPAEAVPGAEPEPLITDPVRFAANVAPLVGLPAFMLGHLDLVRSHAIAAAPLLDGAVSFPVVVHAHGWTGFRAANTNQMEALASRGYIAVGIEHTHGALLTLFPDGRAVPYTPSALPEGVSDEEYHRASNVLVNVYAADVRFVLDQLERFNRGEGGESRFQERLDLARVGLFGHSTGGGAIVLACSLDERCKVGLGMDAWVEPLDEESITQGLTQPFLFMRSEPWTTNDNDARLSRLYAASTGERYRLGIADTTHRDFTLQPLLSPVASLAGLSGPLEDTRTVQLVSDYIVAFFDQTLRDQPAPLLTDPSAGYPEVTLERDGGSVAGEGE